MSATVQTTRPAPKRLKLTRPIIAENDLHASVANALDLLLLPPAVWTTLPIGHVQLTGQQAAKLSRLGVKRGWPDILLIHSDNVFGVELKVLGNRLSTRRLVPTRKGGRRMVDGQMQVFPRLEAAGMRIACCSSVEDVLCVIREWGCPVRGVS